jgi:perosamine synthetase
MVTRNDPDFAARMFRMRVHGIDVDADVRRRSGVVTEQHTEPGFNMGMTGIHAAIDRVQLAGLPETIARRRAHAARYAQNLGAIASTGLPQEPDWARSNWQS